MGVMVYLMTVDSGPISTASASLVGIPEGAVVVALKGVAGAGLTWASAVTGPSAKAAPVSCMARGKPPVSIQLRPAILNEIFEAT